MPTPKPGRTRPGDPPESATLGDLVAELDAESPTPRRDRRRGASGPAAEPTSEDGGLVGEGVPSDPAPAVSKPAVTSAQIFLTSELPIGEEDDLSAVEGEAAPRLVSIVESLLFAASKPLGVRDLRNILKDASVRQIQLALKQLGRDLGSRGVVLAQAAGGFRLRTNPENGRWVQHLLAERPVKLSRSQLESLAVVAYRQPITKPEMDHIRGVDCAAVLKVLLDHDLVRIVGRKEEPGRPHLYGTTLKFLEFFNLRSLRDMPDLHEFRELTEESRAVVREQLGPSALYDDREAMGQEVLHWGGGDAPQEDAGEDDALGFAEPQGDADNATSESPPVVGDEGDDEGDDEAAADDATADEDPEDESAEEESAEDESAEEESAEEESAEEESAEEESAEEESVEDEAPADESAADEAPEDEAPVDESAEDEAPAEESAADEAPADESAGDESADGEAPGDEAPGDEAPEDEALEADASDAALADDTSSDDALADDGDEPTGQDGPSALRDDDDEDR